MPVFENAKWIWNKKESFGDEYCEFYKEFEFKGKKAFLNISCDSDYTLYINGKFVDCNQFFSFEHYMIYDKIDITPYIDIGVNSIAVVVWHIGENKGIQRYYAAKQGLIFEIENQNEEIITFSDTSTLSRLSPTYKNGYKKTISGQIGYSFLYDATKEDAFPKSADKSFTNSCEIKKVCNFNIRPTKKLRLSSKCEATVIRVSEDKTKYLIDLGRETVGVPHLEFFSNFEQKITVAYSECLENEEIRRFVLSHDYSYEYIAQKGENNFTHYMLRLACRYIEISSEKPFKLNYCGILPQYYPVKAKTVTTKEEIDRQIYDICIRTLQLCMLEHYVDCPWREQCLYTFDSRNQMLCGYFAFKDSNFPYAKANLKLISEDKRADNLLSICFPCSKDLTIPCYSLYYILAVKEYLEYSGDIDFIKEIYPKLKSIISTFIDKMKNGLLCKFEDKAHWNFYDWSEYLSGYCGLRDEPIPDIMINLIMIMALDCFKFICDKTENEYLYGNTDDILRKKVNEQFYNKTENAYSVTIGTNEFCDLANAFAVLTDTAKGDIANNICERLLTGTWHSCSLSMKTFVYDALLKNNTEKYKDTVLNDIRKNYKYMLDNGATSVWETLEGYKDQQGSGSLCHGWSSIPVYYYHKLGVVLYQKGDLS